MQSILNDRKPLPYTVDDFLGNSPEDNYHVCENTPSLKVLLLEDNPGDAELIQYALKKSGLRFIPTVVSNRDNFENALIEFQPDVVLSDHSLGSFDSREALGICKNMHITAPFILVTGTVSEEFAVEILKEGADDYILKANLSRLPLAISAALKQKESEKKLIESENRLRSTLDNMLEGAQIISFEWRYLYVNDTVAKQAKCAREELIGKTMMEKYPGIEQTEMFKALEKCMKERSSRVLENEFTYPDGSKGWFELSIQPAPEGLFILSSDITELKRANERLLKEELQRQYTEQLEIFKKETSESLRYAYSLQSALLQEKEELHESLPQSFILYQPKNVVSGDFYWFKEAGDKIYVSVADCTGHGIPGALMTMIGLNSLHGAYNHLSIASPNLLLKFLDRDINHRLSHKSKGKVLNDSMDITICEIDKRAMILTISGANGQVFLIRNEEIQLFKTDRYSIGNAEEGKEFGAIRVPLNKGDSIYMSSDGFMDQFGGSFGKKFSSRRFKELLIGIAREEFHNQEQLLRNAFNQWQGNQEQTDDVLVIGMKI